MSKSKSSVKLKLKEAICTLHASGKKLECASTEKLKVPTALESSMFLNFSFSGNEKDFKLPNIYSTRDGEYEMALVKIKTSAIPKISPFPYRQLNVQLLLSISNKFANYLNPRKINPNKYLSIAELIIAINNLILDIIPFEVPAETMPRFSIDEKNFIRLRNGQPGRANKQITDAVNALLSIDLNTDLGRFFHFSIDDQHVSEIKAAKAFNYITNINYSLLTCDILSESIVENALVPVLYAADVKNDVMQPSYISIARDRIPSIKFKWKHPDDRSLPDSWTHLVAHIRKNGI